jgi:hypothetical protein
MQTINKAAKGQYMLRPMLLFWETVHFLLVIGMVATG